jgi:hypothetical protein
MLSNKGLKEKYRDLLRACLLKLGFSMTEMFPVTREKCNALETVSMASNKSKMRVDRIQKTADTVKVNETYVNAS